MRTHIDNALVGLMCLLSASLAYAEPELKLSHESAFESFDAYKPTQRRDWKSANDHVGKLGGWQYYAREANAPGADKGEVAPAPPSSESSNQDGSGHRMGHDMSNMKGMSMDPGMKHGSAPTGGKP